MKRRRDMLNVTFTPHIYTSFNIVGYNLMYNL